jgi:hypothetical protein
MQVTQLEDKFKPLKRLNDFNIRASLNKFWP